MNNLNLNTSTDSDSYFQNTVNSLQILAEVAITQLGSHRHSVQSHNLHHPGFFDQLKNHDTHDCPLTHFSTSYLPHAESKLVPVKPLCKNQQWDPTRDIQFEVTESFCSGKSEALEPGKAHISGLNNANKTNKQAKQVVSKTSGAKKQAKYAATDKGKKTIASYTATPRAKELEAIRNARKNAKRAATKKGYSPELVNQIVELAAKKKKEALLSGSSFRFPVTKLMKISQSQQQDQRISKNNF